jgi:hypothetical protein
MKSKLASVLNRHFAAMAFLGAAMSIAPTTLNLASESLGWFHTERIGNRWHLVDPQGRPFFSLGVNHVVPQGYADPTGRKRYEEAVLEKYETPQAWATAQEFRFSVWGINTVGAFSDYALFRRSALALTVFIKLSDEDTDYWDPNWERGAQEKIGQLARTYRDDHNVIGYFTDNELWWTSILQAPGTMGREHYILGKYLRRHTAGTALLVDLLKHRYPTVQLFAKDFPDAHLVGSTWSTLADPGLSLGATATQSGQATMLVWAQMMARRYFEVTGKALHAADPHHLNLGVKFIAQVAPRVVLEEAARRVDVISVDFYEAGADAEEFLRRDTLKGSIPSTANTLLEWNRVTGKPLLIAEFGYRAADSGLPNTNPPFMPLLASQHERAARVSNYLTCAIDASYILGAQIFEYVDEPAKGRSDGENSNWGLVNEADEAYTEVTKALAQASALAEIVVNAPGSIRPECVAVGPQS